jgi:glutaconate CoA-transferase subunit B
MNRADVTQYSANEMMTIAAARLLRDDDVCFVGIGMPSAAANLARATVAPNIVLIYESGTIGAKPAVLPLSIGDGELAATADTVVSVPEIFSYWLQAGRIDVGFLGAAQIDKFANINTTVIGDYARPKIRLPGAGGAPEIASAAKEVYIIIEQSPRTFVGACDFITSAGYLDGFDARAKSGARGAGPTVVITDLGILRPDPVSKELTLVGLHPGVGIERARAATGWELRISPALATTPAPTAHELAALRDLHARTTAAHAHGRAASA